MIKTYSLKQREEWFKIVDSFRVNDIFYYPEYVDAYEKNGDGEPILICYTNGNLKAINVVIKREILSIWNFGGRKLVDFITPYGYGGVLFNKRCNSGDKKEFIMEYFEYCRSNNVITEFVRFNPILENFKGLDRFVPVTKLGPTVSIKTQDINQLWQNYSSKNRNTIRKSIKNGVEVFFGNSIDLQKVFRKIYTETMIRDNADPYYYFSDMYFDSLFLNLKYKMKFFYAVYNDEVISIAIILFHRKKVHYHLSATSYEHRNIAPTNLLLYELSKYAVSNGYDEIHLGGGLGGKKDSLYSFKKSFSKEDDNIYAVGKWIFDEEMYELLVKNIDNDSYFPLYRKN